MQEKKKIIWRNLITIGVGLAVVLNIVTLLWIYNLDKHLDIPVSVSSSCNSSRDIRKYLEGVNYGGFKVRPELDEDGRLIKDIEFTLAEKIPQSVVLFHYREALNDGIKGDWKLVKPSEEQVLKYAVELSLDYKKHRIEYQVVQQLNDEIVKASSIRYLDIDYGKGDVEFYYQKYSNSTDIKFLITERHPPITAYQVKEVSFTVFKGNKKEEYAAVRDEHERYFKCELKNSDIDRVRITVIYKDGETLTAELKYPFNQVPRPLFTR